MRELSLFTGAGGGLLGSLILGWEPVQFVEHEPFCQRVLAARFPNVPCHSDIDDFHPVPGSCDIVTGGFPCQPFSQAGKRLGEDDPRNMWPHAVRVLVESGAPLGFFENVPGLLSSGYFGTVLGDLAEAGFNAEWCVLGADDVGAPHRRKRLWILAFLPNADSGGRLAPRIGRGLAGVGGGGPHDAVPAQESGAGVAYAEGQPQRPGLRADEQGGQWRGRPGDEGSPWHTDPADVAHSDGSGREERRRAESVGVEHGAAECGGEVGDPEQGVCGRRADEPRRGPERRTAVGGAGEGESGELGDAALGGQPVRRPPPQSGDERHAVCPDGNGCQGDPWLAEPYVGVPSDGLAAWMGLTRTAGLGG